ncbi:hypothetical protein ES703_82422 [subsurface metagenome]
MDTSISPVVASFCTIGVISVAKTTVETKGIAVTKQKLSKRRI